MIPAFVLLTILVCAGCRSTAPKFSASIVRPDGKAIALINGVYDPGQSWAQANLGPVGAVLGALGTILQSIVPAIIP